MYDKGGITVNSLWSLTNCMEIIVFLIKLLENFVSVHSNNHENYLIIVCALLYESIGVSECVRFKLKKKKTVIGAFAYLITASAEADVYLFFPGCGWDFLCIL